MDVKKIAGLLLAVLLVVPLIATAAPGTLALIDVGLVGLLYVMRRRRSAWATSKRIATIRINGIS